MVLFRKQYLERSLTKEDCANIKVVKTLTMGEYSIYVSI